MRLEDDTDREVRQAWYTVAIWAKAKADNKLPTLASVLTRGAPADPQTRQASMRAAMKAIVAEHNAAVARKAAH